MRYKMAFLRPSKGIPAKGGENELSEELYDAFTRTSLAAVEFRPLTGFRSRSTLHQGTL